MMDSDEMLEPIPREYVYKTVMHRLKRLVDTQLKPGERLPSERDLASRLGVDRSSVRIALHILDALRVVEIRAGQGVFVVDPSRERTLQNLIYLTTLGERFAENELRSALEARVVVEKAALQRAMRHHRPELVQGLESVLGRMSAAHQAGENFAALDEEFHESLVAIAGNLFFQSIHTTLDLLYRQGRETMCAVAENRERFLGQHRALVQAIATGDEERALGLLHECISEEGDAFLRTGRS